MGIGPRERIEILFLDKQPRHSASVFRIRLDEEASGWERFRAWLFPGCRAAGSRVWCFGWWCDVGMLPRDCGVEIEEMTVEMICETNSTVRAHVICHMLAVRSAESAGGSISDG